MKIQECLWCIEEALNDLECHQEDSSVVMNRSQVQKFYRLQDRLLQVKQRDIENEFKNKTPPLEIGAKWVDLGGTL